MAKFDKLQIGEILSETHYYEVVKIAGNQTQLVNEDGQNIVVDSNYINNSVASATQFDKEEKVTRTEMVKIFKENARVAMTVMFNKQLEPKTVTESIAKIYDELGIGLTKEDFTKKVKAVVNLKGEERVMIGRHYGQRDDNGRFTFVDMQVKSGSQDRLVDPRTLNYVIVNNVKYIIK